MKHKLVKHKGLLFVFLAKHPRNCWVAWVLDSASGKTDVSVCDNLLPPPCQLNEGLEPRHFIQIIKNFQCLVISYFNSVVSITKVFTKRPNDCIHLTRLPLQPFCVLWLWVTRITKHQQLLLNKIHHTHIINIRLPSNIF